MLDRSVAPSHSSSYNIEFPRVKQHVLDNGMLLHTLNAGTQPLIKLEVIFPTGGTYYENKAATSLVALKMLREGTPSFTSSQLSNHFAQYGAFMEINPSFDVPSITLYCLSKHLNVVLPHFVEMVSVPTFPDIELNRTLQIEIQQLKLQNEKTSIVASKKFRNLIFGGDHPYGKLINEEDFHNLKQADLKAFHQEMMGKCEIIASGEINEVSISAINNAFKAITSYQLAGPSEPDFSISKGDTVSIKEDKAGALQSSIRAGNLVIKKTHEDYIPLLIASHILGGYFGSRLMKNIREDKGLTYGIYSSIVSLKHNTYMVIGTDVKKEFVEDTISEINSELNTLCTVEVGKQELDTVRNHMIGHFQSKLSSAFSLAEKFKNIYIHNLDYDYYDRYLSTIQSITSREIQETANKYLNPDLMSKVIIG